MGPGDERVGPGDERVGSGDERVGSGDERVGPGDQTKSHPLCRTHFGKWWGLVSIF